MYSVTVYPIIGLIFKIKRCTWWLFHRHFEFTKSRCFFPGGGGGGRQHFRNKDVCEKRQDNAGKDKIIHLFLETGKSTVQF